MKDIISVGIKKFIQIGLLVLAIACLAAVVAKQNAIAKLRVEHETLAESGKEAERLAHENVELEKLRAENKEVAMLQLENKDLPKLRNDVRQLRRQMEEMAALRAENTRLKAIASGGANMQGAATLMNSFPRESLHDVGLGLPRNTLETYYAAICQGNEQRVLDCLTPKKAASSLRHESQFREDIAAKAGEFVGYEIIAREQPGSNEVVLHIRFTNKWRNLQAMRFTLIGNEWKIEP